MNIILTLKLWVATNRLCEWFVTISEDNEYEL